MDVTITNADQDPKRICQNCGSSIEKGNAKRKYCSDNCKTAHYRRKETQSTHLAEQMVKQQEEKIQELESRPVKRTSSVKVVNPAWKITNQAYITQSKICLGLEVQLKDLELEERKMKSGSRGAFYGAATGVAFVLFWIATLYDNRQNKKLGTAFLVGSLFMLLVMGMIGYWVGDKCQTYLPSNNEQINSEIARINRKRDEIERKVNAEQQSLIRLQIGLDQLNQYESEVITSVNEIRG